MAYEYGYGADGGRRWSKDYAAGVQTWYPCGVACCAGELVEQQANLAGTNWTTNAQYLRGIGLVSRNGEFHHFNPIGTVGVVTDTSGAVVSNNLYDSFGVLRYSLGAAQTPWQSQTIRQGTDGISQAGANSYLPARAQPMTVGVICPAWGCNGQPIRPIQGGGSGLGPNPGALFVCTVPIPSWWQRWLAGKRGEFYWCRACAIQCADACPIDDVTCIIICASRQMRCQTRLNYTF